MSASVSVTRQRGQEGTPALVNSAAGDYRVQLFFQLVRDCDASRISGLVQKIVETAEKEKSAQHIADLFLIAFLTRNCRDGKGERLVFYMLFKELALRYPETSLQLAALIPQHGYWKDLFNITSYLQSEFAKDTANSQLEKLLQQWIELVVKLCSDTLQADVEKMEATESPHTLTLLAKYLPNETTAKKRRKRKQLESSLSQVELLAQAPVRWFKLVSKRMFGANRPAMRLRRVVVALRAKLKVTESFMSTNRWNDIDFSRVASKCMMKNRNAFFRHCALALNRAMLSKRINATQLFPHEIVQKLMTDIEAAYLCEVLGEPVAHVMSSNEKLLFELQWEKIRENVVSKMNEKVAAQSVEEGAASAPKEGPAKLVDLTNIVPIVDMSGSMHGIPVAVAVAFGILLSEIVQSKHFNGKLLTFAEEPQWFSFAEEFKSLEQKVREIKSIQNQCGESTNIGLAFDKILEVAIENKLPQDQLPELVIFSDMQFTDATGGDWDTEYEKTRRKFHKAGYELPILTFWNLRSVESGPGGEHGGSLGSMPVEAAVPGVRLLSGFSPHLMKCLLNGEFVEEEVEEEEVDDAAEGKPAEASASDNAEEHVDQHAGSDAAADLENEEETKVGDLNELSELITRSEKMDLPILPRAKKMRVNPLATLRKSLADEAFEDVRSVLVKSTEKLLAGYR